MIFSLKIPSLIFCPVLLVTTLYIFQASNELFFAVSLFLDEFIPVFSCISTFFVLYLSKFCPVFIAT